jgi:hypothetical protein
LSLAKALLKYISLPNAFNQLAQLVSGGGGDTESLATQNRGVFIVLLKYPLPLLTGPLPVWLNRITKIKEK